MRQIIGTKVEEIRREKCMTQDQLKAVDMLAELYHRYEF